MRGFVVSSVEVWEPRFTREDCSKQHVEACRSDQMRGPSSRPL